MCTCMCIREHSSSSQFRNAYDTGFLDFGGFQWSETPIKHGQNLKLMAELNSTSEDGPISVNN